MSHEPLQTKQRNLFSKLLQALHRETFPRDKYKTKHWATQTALPNNITYRLNVKKEFLKNSIFTANYAPPAALIFTSTPAWQRQLIKCVNRFASRLHYIYNPFVCTDFKLCSRDFFINMRTS